MIRFDRTARSVAFLLAALAGYVDAVGFIQLGGAFVSFMSGNSTRLSVGLVQDRSQALVAGGLIAAFVAGVALGSLVGHAAGPPRPAAVLGIVAGHLALAAILYVLNVGFVGAALLVLAMGALNTVFEHQGEIRVGLTYMTGALVRVGQRLASALRGVRQWDWVPHALLWLSLVGGAVAGTLLHHAAGPAALWLPAALAAALAVFADRLGLAQAERVREVGP